MIKNDAVKILRKLPSESSIKVPPISIVNKNLGKIYTETIEGDHISVITTKLKDEFNSELGKEVFTMGYDVLYGQSIEVDPLYRNKGCRLGEILRLSSIMMFLENKINKFLIYSLPTAVYFHSKYKFMPYVDDMGACEVALKTMITNCNQKGYGDIKILGFAPKIAETWATSEGIPKKYLIYSGNGYSDHLPIMCNLVF